ncbi:hypothetical protein O6H91_22G041500 [Diphasiastrum complanatum]|uniref:Uncharacterized protein n=1 Tax=Diphasiastrum complanatum TaxID=34168 RepID=A0ACC2AEQ0_DIPCM|nr:hypothetical protein O6H91_22G041500 [Diphasiastrum complanatum]
MLSTWGLRILISGPFVLLASYCRSGHHFVSVRSLLGLWRLSEEIEADSSSALLRALHMHYGENEDRPHKNQHGSPSSLTGLAIFGVQRTSSFSVGARGMSFFADLGAGAEK